MLHPSVPSGPFQANPLQKEDLIARSFSVVSRKID
jgi:hypothetical protein